MSIRLAAIPHYSYSSPDYSLSVFFENTESKIIMQMHNGIYSTSNLPHTTLLLRRHLPGIFSTECFNEANLPFSKEVEQTEVAHLFEHILLEYLCKLKIYYGTSSVVVNGVTTWDWYNNPMGRYQINIDTGIQDKKIFSTALNKSTKLFNKIIEQKLLIN